MLLTIDRVREVLKNSPLLTDEDWIDLYKAANEDPDETTEWLPYYKLQTSLLCMAIGSSNTALNTALVFLRNSHPAEAVKVERVLKESMATFLLSLYPVGLGPGATLEAFARNDKFIEIQKQKLESIAGFKIPPITAE